MSQRAAYASAVREPLFKGANGVEVNMNFVARTLNFFKYHLRRKDEHTLYSDYNSLAPEDRVKSWRRKLVNGQRMLGRNWKGVYAYLEHDDLVSLRDGSDDEQVLPDNFNDDHDSVFQVR